MDKVSKNLIKFLEKAAPTHSWEKGSLTLYEAKTFLESNKITDADSFQRFEKSLQSEELTYDRRELFGKYLPVFRLAFEQRDRIKPPVFYGKDYSKDELITSPSTIPFNPEPCAGKTLTIRDITSRINEAVKNKRGGESDIAAIVKVFWQDQQYGSENVFRMEELAGVFKYIEGMRYDEQIEARKEFFQEMGSYVKDRYKKQEILDSLLMLIQSTDWTSGDLRDMKGFVKELAEGIATHAFAEKKARVIANYDGTQHKNLFGSIVLIKDRQGKLLWEPTESDSSNKIGYTISSPEETGEKIEEGSQRESIDWRSKELSIKLRDDLSKVESDLRRIRDGIESFPTGFSHGRSDGIAPWLVNTLDLIKKISKQIDEIQTHGVTKKQVGKLEGLLSNLKKEIPDIKEHGAKLEKSIDEIQNSLIPPLRQIVETKEAEIKQKEANERFLKSLKEATEAMNQVFGTKKPEAKEEVKEEPKKKVEIKEEEPKKEEIKSQEPKKTEPQGIKKTDSLPTSKTDLSDVDLPPGGRWETYQLPGIGTDGIDFEENEKIGLFDVIDQNTGKKLKDYTYLIQRYYTKEGNPTKFFRFHFTKEPKEDAVVVGKTKDLDEELVKALQEKLKKPEQVKTSEAQGGKQEVAQEKQQGAGSKPAEVRAQLPQETQAEKAPASSGGNVIDEVFNYDAAKVSEISTNPVLKKAPQVHPTDFFKDPGEIIRVRNNSEYPYSVSALDLHIKYEKEQVPSLDEKRVRNYFGNLNNLVAQKLMEKTGAKNIDEAINTLKQTKEGKETIIKTIAECLILGNWVYRPAERLSDCFNPEHVKKKEFVYSDCNTLLQDAYLGIACNLGLPIYYVPDKSHAYGVWKDNVDQFEIEVTASRKKTSERVNETQKEIQWGIPAYEILITQMGYHARGTARKLTSYGQRVLLGGGIFCNPMKSREHLEAEIKLNLNSYKLQKVGEKIAADPSPANLQLLGDLVAEDIKIISGIRDPHPNIVYGGFEKLKAYALVAMEVSKDYEFISKIVDNMEEYLKKYKDKAVDDGSINEIRTKLRALQSPLKKEAEGIIKGIEEQANKYPRGSPAYRVTKFVAENMRRMVMAEGYYSPDTEEVPWNNIALTGELNFVELPKNEWQRYQEEFNKHKHVMKQVEQLAERMYGVEK